MNPCRCGYLGDPARACGRAPACGRSYSARVSGPMLDRFDLIIEVPEVSARMLLHQEAGEASKDVAMRVQQARSFAATRHEGSGNINARLTPHQLDNAFAINKDAQQLLKQALDKAHLSARGYHKVLRVARTIADLAAQTEVNRAALAEALAYRAMPLLA